MKITIDTGTVPHRVQIDGECTLGELTDFLSQYYPDFTWRNVRICGNGIVIGSGGFGETGGSGSSLNSPWYVPAYPGSTITYRADTGTITNSAVDRADTIRECDEK